MRIKTSDDKRSDEAQLKGRNEYGATPFQIGLGLLIVGASAGMTIYTKKTKAMLTQMERVKNNQDIRLPKKKLGPSKTQ